MKIPIQIQQIILQGDIKTQFKIKFTGLDESHFQKTNLKPTFLSYTLRDTLSIIKDTHRLIGNYVRLKELRCIFSSFKDQVNSRRPAADNPSLSAKNSFHLLVYAYRHESSRSLKCGLLYSVWWRSYSLFVSDRKNNDCRNINA